MFHIQGLAFKIFVVIIGFIKGKILASSLCLLQLEQAQLSNKAHLALITFVSLDIRPTVTGPQVEITARISRAVRVTVTRQEEGCKFVIIAKSGESARVSRCNQLTEALQRVVDVSVVAGRAPVTCPGAYLCLARFAVTLSGDRVTHSVIICYTCRVNRLHFEFVMQKCNCVNWRTARSRKCGCLHLTFFPAQNEGQ